MMSPTRIVVVMALPLLLGVAAPPVGSLAADDAAITADEAALAAYIKRLHDSNSNTRAEAATGLRRLVAKYPSGTVYLRSNDGRVAAWQEKVNQIKQGMTKAEVVKLLPPFPEAPDGIEIWSGQSHFANYRLDYHWTVTASYRNPDKVIDRPTLKQRTLSVYVAPPKNFTGAWITWHVNGQMGHEIHFKNGKYDGTFTSYHDNGAKSVEQHYSNHEADGADTGWSRDGNKTYSGEYLNGKQDGKWTHWYANGQKQCESNYDKGKRHGLDEHWYQNGQISSVNSYKDDAKHGIEASWNEKGVLNYKRIYENGKLVER